MRSDDEDEEDEYDEENEEDEVSRKVTRARKGLISADRDGRRWRGRRRSRH